MLLKVCTSLLVLSAWMAAARGDEKMANNASGCSAVVDDFFKNEVWANVGSQKCLTCHKTGGDAEKSKFILLDPKRSQGPALDEAMKHNREAFAKIAKMKEKDQSRVLLKVVGGLDHGGADVLKANSTGYRILADFVRRMNSTSINTPLPNVVDKNAPPFFDGITMLDDRR
ncbi:MAG: hypothetical protein K8T89_11020, partial [Planctomycetes bacterium]|nr:hypothetical protein [Planctomycetota bacterium]